MNNELVPIAEDPLGHHRAGLLRGLRAHYGDGKDIRASFSTTDTPSRALYYKLKSAHPAAMEALEEEARQLGLRQTRKVLTALDSEMLGKSVIARGRASDALLESIDQLKAMALGATFTVNIPSKDGEGTYQQTIITRPSAQIAAAELLWKIAKEGLTTLETTEKPGLVDEGTQSHRVSSLPSLGVPIDFSEVSATLPDGTKLTVTRERDDVMDAEFEEAGAPEETPASPAT